MSLQDGCDGDADLIDRGHDEIPQRDIAAMSPRWRAVGGIVAAAVTVAFVVSVVRSTQSASVPVGASGTMSGMAMGTNRIQAAMRDIDGRPVGIPAGRPGLVIFAEARGCDGCALGVRAAQRAVADTSSRAQLIVVMLDSSTSRADVRTFARSTGAGESPRYVIDDRDSRVASTFDVTSVGSAVVYDAVGRVVARPEPGSGQFAAALRRATR